MSSECCYYLGCLHCSSHPHQTLFLRVQCTCDNLVISPGGVGRNEAEMINITTNTSFKNECIFQCNCITWEQGIRHFIKSASLSDAERPRVPPSCLAEQDHEAGNGISTTLPVCISRHSCFSSLQCSCCFIPFSVSFLSTTVWSTLKVRSLTVNHSLQM